MFTLLNSQLADQYRCNIQREAERDRLASLYCGPIHVGKGSKRLTISSILLYMTRLLSRQAVVQAKPALEEVPLTEIKPAIEATFSVMREVGLISDYDDSFIEQFDETFERELVHQAQCMVHK